MRTPPQVPSGLPGGVGRPCSLRNAAVVGLLPRIAIEPALCHPQTTIFALPTTGGKGGGGSGREGRDAGEPSGVEAPIVLIGLLDALGAGGPGAAVAAELASLCRRLLRSLSHSHPSVWRQLVDCGATSLLNYSTTLRLS